MITYQQITFVASNIKNKENINICTLRHGIIIPYNVSLILVLITKRGQVYVMLSGLYIIKFCVHMFVSLPERMDAHLTRWCAVDPECLNVKFICHTRVQFSESCMHLLMGDERRTGWRTWFGVIVYWAKFYSIQAVVIDWDSSSSSHGRLLQTE